ncbi:MAG TPA: hypothetical protein VGW78_02530 [Candidatus Babeliales bacterium]|nr:hypothetical protein [Candidatus Babeliales bacterium]
MKQYSYILVVLLYAIPLCGMMKRECIKHIRNDEGSLTLERNIKNNQRTLKIHFLAGPSYTTNVNLDTYFDPNLDYSFHLFSSFDKQYIHGYNSQKALILGFYLGNNATIQEQVKPYFKINDKSKEYSTTLLYNFPQLHNKILSVNPTLTTKTKSNPLYTQYQNNAAKEAQWNLNVPDKIKDSVGLLLDYFQKKQANPFDADKQTLDMFFSTLKGRTDKEQIIKYIAASHILGNYERKTEQKTHLIDLVGYFIDKVLDVHQKSCGWLPGNREVTINPVGHVQVHQRGIYGWIKKARGHITTNTIFDGHTKIAEIKSQIRHEQPDIQAITNIINKSYKYYSPIVNSSLIALVTYPMRKPGDMQMSIDVYNHIEQKNIPTVNVSSCDDDWHVRDIAVYGADGMDILEAAYKPGTYESLKPKNNFTGLLQQQFKRYANGELKQTIPIKNAGGNRIIVQEVIKYENVNNKEGPYLEHIQGFWDNLLGPNRFALSQYNPVFQHINCITFFNILNPFAWIRAITQTWAEYRQKI